MALLYETLVLLAICLKCGIANRSGDFVHQPNSISVCKERYWGCRAFFNKNDDYQSYRQCRKDCGFQSAEGAKPIEAYECTDWKHDCSPVTYYDSTAEGDDFLEFIQCIQMCHELSDDKGQTPEKNKLCDYDMSTCFEVANRNNSLSFFVKCYAYCQVYQEERHTLQYPMYICNAFNSRCISVEYFSLPDDPQPFKTLEECYNECKVAEDEMESGGDTKDEEQ